MADRLNLRWLYAAALLIWSAAGFATGLARDVVLLSLCRLVLGMGEAFNWPCAVSIVRRLVPLESRSMANGIFHSGASAGAILTPLLMLASVGDRAENWRLLFQVVGALGLVWVVLWLWFVRGQRAEQMSRLPEDAQAPAVAPGTITRPESFLRVLERRQFWITLAVGVTVNICWHFYRVWLPRFLDVDLKLSNHDIQLTLMAFYLAADVGSLSAGYLTAPPHLRRRIGRTLAQGRAAPLFAFVPVVTAGCAGSRTCGRSSLDFAGGGRCDGRFSYLFCP